MAKKENRRFRHELVGEFREVLTTERDILPTETQGIVVLDYFEGKSDSNNIEDLTRNPENSSRIAFAANIFKDIAAQKLGKRREELTSEDLLAKDLPLFAIVGLTASLQTLKELSKENGIPEEKIHLVDNGKIGVGNTKTQFENVVSNPALGHATHLTFVSQSYHVPRLWRTADATLPDQMNYEILGVALSQMPYNVYRKVRGEIKRIIAYSAKGDISHDPRPQ